MCVISLINEGVYYAQYYDVHYSYDRKNNGAYEQFLYLINIHDLIMPFHWLIMTIGALFIMHNIMMYMTQL